MSNDSIGQPPSTLQGDTVTRDQDGVYRSRSERLMARLWGREGKHASPHRWVRMAMYTVLLLVAALATFQAWRFESANTLRKMDADIIRVASEQSTVSQKLGPLAVMLAIPDFDFEQRQGDFSINLAQAKDRVQRLEELLAQQGAPYLAAAPDLNEAVQEWREVCARLWASASTLVAQRDRNDMQSLRAAIKTLQNDLEAAQFASQVLITQTQAQAQLRSDAAALQIKVWAGFTLALLLLLAVVLVEPTARAVRRQHEALTHQTGRLERLALVAERSSNAVVIADAQQHVVWVNEAFTKILGFNAHDAMGQGFNKLLQDGSDDPSAFAAITRALRQGLGLKREVKIIAASGEPLWVQIDLQPIFDDADVLSGWVLIAADLTEVRAQQQQLELAIEGAGLGTWQWNIVTGALQCNERLLQIVGFQAGDLGMKVQDWNAHIHPDDFPAWSNSVAAHLANPALPHRMSIRFKGTAGRWSWVMVTGTVVDRTPDGKPLRMAGVAMDVQAQKVMEQQLRAAARTDGLTQLPNRAVVLDKIEAAILRGRGNAQYRFAVLFMDFDRFKQVNDTLGHGVGDELLRQIAHRLQDSLRPGDSFIKTSPHDHVAARIGGDEFVVLLDDLRSDRDAELVAARLIDVLAMPYVIGTHRVNSTVSIGIVTTAHAADDADSVLRDADIAMYEAKRGGRACYVMFEPSMRQQLTASAALESDLRLAIENKEFFVVYQPLVDMQTGRLSGLEALMRWRHPQRGLVSPVEFIPVAEASGLIGVMGMYVLQQACRDFATMQAQLGEMAPKTVAVNLSRAQLRESTLVDEVRKALEVNQLQPHHLILEVTESLAAQDALVLGTLHGLRALGVALSLDDFGTGYSSLSCLHELPVNFVKIDRSFVSQAQNSAYHRVLIEATIRMAQTLGLGTVAEGIETAGQADLMAQLGCNKGQGYLYSKPLDVPALVDWARVRA
jgi:diguanylate cyclase (GGDEF)-like protein/PAS domain S-box-containing protein